MDTHDTNKSRHKRAAAVLAAAEQVLAELCRYSPDQAFDALLDVAHRHHIDVVALAGGLLELTGDVPASASGLRGAAAAAFQQWGRLLTSTTRTDAGSEAAKLPVVTTAPHADLRAAS